MAGKIRPGMLSDYLGSVAAGLSAQIALLGTGVLTARAMGPEDRGWLVLFVLLPITVAQLAALGMPGATTYFVARRGPGESVSRPPTGLILTQVAVATVAIMTLAIIAHWAGWLPARLAPATVVALAGIPASLVQQYAFALLQGIGKIHALSVFRVLQPFAYLSGVVVAFVLGSREILDYVVAWVLPVSTVAAAAWILSRRWSQASATFRTGEVARMGIRNYISSLAPFEGLRLDQLVVFIAYGPVSAGLYAVSLSVGTPIRFLGQSVGLVVYPQIAANAELGRAVLRRSILSVAVFGLAIAVTGVIAYPELVPALFGGAFVNAVPTAQAAALTSAALAVRRVAIDAARGAGYAAVASASEVVLVFVCIATAALLKPPLVAFVGVIGSVATLTAVGLVMATHWALPRAGAPQT